MENSKNKYKNVVLFTFCGVGDFILATSAIALIKNYNKNIKVTLVMCEEYISLVSDKLQVDEIITLKHKYNVIETNFLCRIFYKLFWSVKNFFKLYKKDLCILLDYSVAFNKIAKYIFRIKKVIDEKTISNKTIHSLVKYQNLIRNIYPTQNLALPVLPDTKSIKEELKRKFLQNTKKYKIAICTRTSAEIRNWDIDNFNNLIKIINKIFNATFFVLGNSSKEIENGNFLIRQNKDIDIRNLCGKTSLLELKEVLVNMDLLISVDTGTVHFAAIKNIPTIGIYGFSSYNVPFFPTNYNLIGLFAQEKPDSEDMKPKMNKITPEIVLNEVCKILK